MGGGGGGGGEGVKSAIQSVRSGLRLGAAALSLSLSPSEGVWRRLAISACNDFAIRKRKKKKTGVFFCVARAPGERRNHVRRNYTGFVVLRSRVTHLRDAD